MSIGPVEDTDVFPVANAHIVQSLTLDNKYVQSQLDLSKWPHLNDIPLPRQLFDIQEIAIGEDVPQAHTPFATVYGSNQSREPYAVHTPFGWCIAGPNNRHHHTHSVTLALEQTVSAIQEMNAENPDLAEDTRNLDEAVNRL
jgi:desulfoferrodoxin (superoxide reductase-like protein)